MSFFCLVVFRTREKRAIKKERQVDSPCEGGSGRMLISSHYEIKGLKKGLGGGTKTNNIGRQFQW